MNYKLSRHRFAQLAIIAITGIAINQLTNKAQQNLLIVGLRLGSVINPSSVPNLTLDSLNDDSEVVASSTEISQEISFVSLNEVTG